jgi:hypothetical protein
MGSLHISRNAPWDHEPSFRSADSLVREFLPLGPRPEERLRSTKKAGGPFPDRRR